MLKLFFDYLYGHRRCLSVLAVFAAVFTTSFLLYHLPLEAVLYPTGLCLFLGALFLLVDFRRVRKRHLELLEIRSRTAAMIDTLPPPERIEDTEYQIIIQALKSEVAHCETAAALRFNGIVDYYTLWAHQIKTPIASMRLTLQNEDTPLSRKLSSDQFRIEQYVEMVLAFLRLDSDTTDYLIRPYALDPLIREAVRNFAGEFIARRIKLIYEPLAYTVITDRKWFIFVLEQLLSNALKYTPEGSICIYMRDTNTLCIQDTGIGIAPEDLPRIFEKGYTGYNGRSPSEGNCSGHASGLGLYLCRRICGKLGHGIAAESCPDCGTTILLDLSQYRTTWE